MEFKYKLKQIPCVKIKIPSFYLIFLLHKKHLSSSFLLRQAHLKMQVILGWTLMWTCLFELIKLSLNTKVKLFFNCIDTVIFTATSPYLWLSTKKNEHIYNFDIPTSWNVIVFHTLYMCMIHIMYVMIWRRFLSGLVILLSSLFVLSLFVLRCLSISVL